MFCLWILSGCYWQLLQQVNTLTSTVDSLNATINAQAQLIAQLNQIIQELKEQLNKNSQNNTRRGDVPSDVKAAVQYGENLQALAVVLNTVGAVSVKRTHEILSGVFNIPIATGTISSMVKRCPDFIFE